MPYDIRRIDESKLVSVLRLRRVLSQPEIAVIATALKSPQFPFRNRSGYGPKCSGHAKPSFGCIGTFDGSVSIRQLSLSGFYARHTLPTGDAWVSPSAFGPCIPMFQTESAYENWLSTDGMFRQNSADRRTMAACISRDVKARQS